MGSMPHILQPNCHLLSYELPILFSKIREEQSPNNGVDVWSRNKKSAQAQKKGFHNQGCWSERWDTDFVYQPSEILMNLRDT